MSMEFKKPLRDLTRCPSCRSRRLVVAVYRPRTHGAGTNWSERYLECEGCCSVVAELPDNGELGGILHTSVLERRSRIS